MAMSMARLKALMAFVDDATNLGLNLRESCHSLQVSDGHEHQLGAGVTQHAAITGVDVNKSAVRIQNPVTLIGTGNGFFCNSSPTIQPQEKGQNHRQHQNTQQNGRGQRIQQLICKPGYQSRHCIGHQQLAQEDQREHPT